MTNTHLNSSFIVPEILPILFLNIDQYCNKIEIIFSFLEYWLFTFWFDPCFFPEEKSLKLLNTFW